MNKIITQKRITETEYLKYFKHPELAEAWAKVVSEDVYPYLAPLTAGRKNGGKMLWGIVIKESERLDILNEDTEHQVAAELLAAACPGCFENIDSLKVSLDNFHREVFREDNRYRSVEYGPRVREMLRACVPCQQEALRVEASLAEHAQAIAEKIVNFEYNRKSSFVRCHPMYQAGMHSVSPAVSIETFPDQTAIEDNAPSSIVSFECVEESVSDARIEMLHSRYGHFGGRHHLIIVTRVGFNSEQARLLCLNYNMGLWRVNVDGSYERIFSRSVNDLGALHSAWDSLFGGPSQSKDIVYADGELMMLPELLVDWGVRVKPGFILKAPYYSKEKIKNLAADHLREIGFKGYGFTVNGIVRLADVFHFTWECGPLMNHQLGICNFDENHIIISDTLLNDPHRWRFTFGHDSGHFILQKKYVAPFVHVFGESEETLISCNFRREQLRWLEWQANQYSCYLLMPDDIMKNLIRECFDDRMKRMGYLYVDNQKDNDIAYKMTLHKMSQLANMSMEALHYRLKDMGCLVDERKKPERIGQVIRELKW